MRKWFVVLAPAAALLVLAGCASTGRMQKDESMFMADPMGASFTVKVEVLDGSATPIAPVAWAVYTGDNPLFTTGTAMRIPGLEALAEDGDPSGVAKALPDSMEVVTSGVAAVPEGAMDAGPAGPGHAYTFQFSASEGERLGFATMYVQSNDLFFAPAGEGLELFDMGRPISGDVTSRIVLYDAGTEVNEKPGSGAHQAPRQMGPNSGMDEMAAVRPIGEATDGYMYPAVDRVIRVTVSTM